MKKFREGRYDEDTPRSQINTMPATAVTAQSPKKIANICITQRSVEPPTNLNHSWPCRGSVVASGISRKIAVVGAPDRFARPNRADIVVAVVVCEQNGCFVPA